MKDKANAYQRLWRSKNTEKAHAYKRKSYLKKRYGVTQEGYDAMYRAQDGKCAICGDFRPSGGRKGLAVDHNHQTGEVRGLLCGECNIAIARFETVSEFDARVNKYLVTKGKEDTP